jgi:hypothetical protein
MFHMEGGRVVIFEGDLDVKDNLVDTLYRNRHVVVRSARDLPGVFAVAEAIASGKLGTDVIVLDANLSQGSETPDGPFRDGVASYLRRERDAGRHNATVVAAGDLGHSAIAGADKQVRRDADEIVAAINALPEPGLTEPTLES